MKILLALGNPGSDYAKTRHNVGFMLADAIAKEWNTDFQEKPKFKAMIAETTQHGEKILIVKPTTFYNNVGESARAIRDFYKLSNTDILAIHDEMALPLGTIRTRTGGSDAGNNGIKSLNQHLGHDYARVRVGIWTEQREHIDAVDYVLGKINLTSHQQTALTTQVSAIVSAFVSGGFSASTYSF